MRILFYIQYRRRLVEISCVFLVIAIISLFVIAKNDLRYYGNVPSISTTRDQICDLRTENDLLLIDHYLHPFWWYYSNFGCIQPTWAGLPYPHQTAIHTEFFYPRLTDTIQIAGEWLKTGKVLLVTTLQEENLSYQQSFPESGFSLTEIIDGNLAPFTIYQLKETAP